MYNLPDEMHGTICSKRFVLFNDEADLLDRIVVFRRYLLYRSSSFPLDIPHDSKLARDRWSYS